MEEFVTIKDNAQTEIVEKKSKFIANIFKVNTQKEAEDIIKETKKKYYDARHNCVAYRVIEDENIVEKSSDDGEPSGTAGGPMLNILQKNNFINVVVIVTRYFGGILLGTGGLVRAYSEAITNVIQAVEKAKISMGYEMEVTMDYNYFENFKYYCKNNDISIVKSDYAENIICKIEMENQVKEKILKDYKEKNIKLKEIKELSRKNIIKSI